MSAAIDVAIGLAFLYLILALVVTTVQELIATYLSWRARDLYTAIEKMLRGSGTTPDRTQAAAKESARLLTDLYEHPLIRNLRKDPQGGGRASDPSYIPSKTFALALLDVLQHEKSTSEATGVRQVIAGASEAIDAIKVPSVKRALKVLVDDARRAADKVDDEATVVTTAIEGWFNDRMARAGGWYKRKAQLLAMGLATLIVGLTNADTIQVAGALWHSPALREVAVVEAKKFHEAHPTLDAAPEGQPSNADADVNADLAKLDTFPIGWSACPCETWPWILKVAGLLLSMFAVSLGSAFWFDMLGRVLQLRGTGPRVSTATGQTEQKQA